MSLSREIALDSSLAASSDTLAQFRTMAAGSRYARLVAIENALADEDTATAATLLAIGMDVDTTTAYDTTTAVWMADDVLADTVVKHYIDVYKLQLRYLRETMNHADSCEVTSLASLCPMRDGDVVFIARNLYRLIYNDSRNFSDNCNDSVGMAPCDSCGWMGRYANPGKHPRSIQNSGTKNNYTLFPNPNRGSFTLTHRVAEEQNVNVAVLDAVGREVYNQVLMFTDSKVDVVLSNVPSGVYLLVVTDSHGEKSKFKFVISK